MGKRNRYPGIEEYAVRLIQIKAYQLTGQAGFTPADREDLEQDLMLDLLTRMPKYNPNIAERSTFISRIVNHRVARILEERGAKMRDWRMNEFSLNENDPACEEPTERQENFSEEDYLLRTGRIDEPQEGQRDLELDLDRALELLPDDYRDLCERLRTRTVSEVAQELGVSRSSVYESIQRVREIFENTGLRNYL